MRAKRAWDLLFLSSAPHTSPEVPLHPTSGLKPLLPSLLTSAFPPQIPEGKLQAVFHARPSFLALLLAF